MLQQFKQMIVTNIITGGKILIGELFVLYLYNVPATACEPDVVNPYPSTAGQVHCGNYERKR